MMRYRLAGALAAGAVAMLPTLAVGAGEKEPLLENGGFEETAQVEGVAEDGGKHRLPSRCVASELR